LFDSTPNRMSHAMSFCKRSPPDTRFRDELILDVRRIETFKLMTTRKALIVGSTGLIGEFCLQALVDEPTYSEIIALVRKPLPKTHRKLKTIITEFDNLESELSNLHIDDVYCCLGTTIKKAGSRDAFKKVDLGLVAAIAELVRKQGAEQLLVISAMGANKDSKFFYNRVKGEMEAALQKMGYPCLRIIRPSLLLGPRKEFRLGEKTAVLLTHLFKPFLLGSLKKYRPVQAEEVAQFMVQVALEEPFTGVHVYESNVIEQKTCSRAEKSEK
jgi:uncharacterized protein YbjT (DUF2867 family)